ncbi:MAG: universal stress protein [Deltaproteobacteria bacterium]|nr:universal stress protein [Deltaproteobacteria bacterium]
MNKIKKILAPTDLSELSQVGIRYALEMARDTGAEVTVYHVVDREEFVHYGEALQEKASPEQSPNHPEHLLQKCEQALSRFINDHFSELTPGLQIRELVEIGTADDNIVEQAKKDGANLIIISTHGRTGISHILLGSVTEKVVRRAPCPVLSIHP